MLPCSFTAPPTPYLYITVETSPFCSSGEYKNIVVMCGAGISVNAGIPDFRSPSAGTVLYCAVLKLSSWLNYVKSSLFYIYHNNCTILYWVTCLDFVTSLLNELSGLYFKLRKYNLPYAEAVFDGAYFRQVTLHLSPCEACTLSRIDNLVSSI